MTSDGWNTRPLRDLCERITDGSHLSPAPVEDGLPIATVRNMRSQEIDLDSCARISERDFANLERNGCRPQIGDVLFSKDGSLGKVLVMRTDPQFVLLSSIAILTPKKDQVDGSFLGQCLKSSETLRTLYGMRTGTAIKRIVLRDLRRLRLSVPPLLQQRKIAVILSSMDDAIEKTQAVIDQTQVVKRGVMDELFTRGLPGWHGTLKKTEITSVPEEWRVLSAVKALATKPRNGRSPRARAKPPGVPTFSIAAVRGGRVDIFGNLKYVDLTDEEAKEFRIHQGDILVVRGNANEALLGRCGVVNDYPDGCIYPDILMRLVPNENFDSRYFAYLWNTDLIHSQLRAKAKTTSGTLKINQADVSTVLLPCPNLAEQLRIVGVVEGIDHFDSMNREALSAYRQVKEALMSVLLTGELRVAPDPEPE